MLMHKRACVCVQCAVCTVQFEICIAWFRLNFECISKTCISTFNYYNLQLIWICTNFSIFPPIWKPLLIQSSYRALSFYFHWAIAIQAMKHAHEIGLAKLQISASLIATYLNHSTNISNISQTAKNTRHNPLFDGTYWIDVFFFRSSPFNIKYWISDRQHCTLFTVCLCK